MFSLSGTILLMSMGTGHKMGDANVFEEGI
jgi:hypothetical protein